MSQSQYRDNGACARSHCSNGRSDVTGNIRRDAVNSSSASGYSCTNSGSTSSSACDLQSNEPLTSRAKYNLRHREQSLNYKKKRNIADIDGIHCRTPSYDPSYGWSIWMQQRNLELPLTGPSKTWSGVSSTASAVSAPFTVRQPELDDSMRCALLLWLSEVTVEYKMQTPTYFLAARLLDRVLMQLPIKKTKFQMLGCACLMIAGKLEEIEAPSTENLVLLADNSFDVESLVNMEHTVLRMLEFNVSVHTSYYFATRLALAASMSDKEKNLMLYLLEVSLYDFSMSYELMSKVAAAAAHLAIQALRSLSSPVWGAALEHYSGYRDSDPTLRALIYHLRSLHWNLESSPYSNIGKKFSKASTHRVSHVAAVRADNVRFSLSTHLDEEMESVNGGVEQENRVGGAVHVMDLVGGESCVRGSERASNDAPRPTNSTTVLSKGSRTVDSSQLIPVLAVPRLGVCDSISREEGDVSLLQAALPTRTGFAVNAGNDRGARGGARGGGKSGVCSGDKSNSKSNIDGNSSSSSSSAGTANANQLPLLDNTHSQAQSLSRPPDTKVHGRKDSGTGTGAGPGLETGVVSKGQLGGKNPGVNEAAIKPVALESASDWNENLVETEGTLGDSVCVNAPGTVEKYWSSPFPVPYPNYLSNEGAANGGADVGPKGGMDLGPDFGGQKVVAHPVTVTAPIVSAFKSGDEVSTGAHTASASSLELAFDGEKMGGGKEAPIAAARRMSKRVRR